MAEEKREPIPLGKRLWKFAEVILPALIGGYFSLLEAKADTAKKHEDSRQSAKASYETLQKAVADLQGELKASELRTEKLESVLTEMTEQSRKAEQVKAPHKTPTVKRFEPPPAPTAVPLNLPEHFEDAVENFKAPK